MSDVQVRGYYRVDPRTGRRIYVRPHRRTGRRRLAQLERPAGMRPVPPTAGPVADVGAARSLTQAVDRAKPYHTWWFDCPTMRRIMQAVRVGRGNLADAVTAAGKLVPETRLEATEEERRALMQCAERAVEPLRAQDDGSIDDFLKGMQLLAGAQTPDDLRAGHALLGYIRRSDSPLADQLEASRIRCISEFESRIALRKWGVLVYPFEYEATIWLNVSVMLARRLRDSNAFRKLAHAMRDRCLSSDLGYLLGDQIAATCMTLMRCWALTSCDDSPWSIALQRATAEAFQLGTAYPAEPRSEETRAEVERILRDHGDALRDFVRALHQHTQAVLREAGIGRLRVYRGVAVQRCEEVPPPARPGEASTAIVHKRIRSRALSSWSLSPWKAAGFMVSAKARGYGSGAYLLAADVPAQRVLAIGAAGLGCAAEHEVVVLGGEDVVTAVAIQEAE